MLIHPTPLFAGRRMWLAELLHFQQGPDRLGCNLGFVDPNQMAALRLVHDHTVLVDNKKVVEIVNRGDGHEISLQLSPERIRGDRKRTQFETEAPTIGARVTRDERDHKSDLHAEHLLGNRGVRPQTVVAQRASAQAAETVAIRKSLSDAQVVRGALNEHPQRAGGGGGHDQLPIDAVYHKRAEVGTMQLRKDHVAVNGARQLADAFGQPARRFDLLAIPKHRCLVGIGRRGGRGSRGEPSR